MTAAAVAPHASATAEFWAGEFGNAYHQRNVHRVQTNIALFAKVLARTGLLHSVIEFGCGIGENLAAIHRLMPSTEIWGVELNEQAVATSVVPNVIHGSMLEDTIFADYSEPSTMAMTKGVLIHIAPEDLPAAYARLHRAAQRFILVAEYYNPVPVEVPYRGHAGRLWKRDFAGELLDRYRELRLVDYGFVYHRDVFTQDDLTWFLMEKLP